MQQINEQTISQAIKRNVANNGRQGACVVQILFILGYRSRYLSPDFPKLQNRVRYYCQKSELITKLPIKFLNNRARYVVAD